MKVTQLCPNSLGPHGLCSPWNSPGQNTGVGSLSLLQGSFQPGDQTQVSLIAGGFFNSWATREAHKTYKWHKWLGQKLFFKYFKGTLGCSIAPFLYAKVKKAFGGNWTELQRHKARNQAVKSKGTKHIERHGFFSTGNLDLRPWPEVELDSLGSKSNVFVRGSFWSISWASSTWGTGSKGAGGRQNTQMGSARKSRRRPSVSGKLASVKSVLAFNKRLTGRPDSHGSVFTITCAQNILTTGQARTDGSSPLSDGEPDLQRQSHMQVWSWAGPSDRVDSIPDGDPREGRLVSWKPNAEGLAGRAEAPQVCSGSRCPGHPPPGGVGVREPKSWDLGAGAKGEGRQRAYSTRYSQAVSHPSKNQARPCLASEIRRDRARSGCYGLRRRPLPPGALRALRCASLSLWPAGQPFRLQVILLLPLSLPAFWESLSFHTRWCNEWMP